MPLALIDTNLLIYPYDGRAPHKALRARQVLEQLEQAQTGRLSVQNLAEFISVSTRRLNPPLSRAEALTQASLFTRIWPVFPLTPLIVLEAARGCRDYDLSYYDAQIWACARLNQITLVFSEDFSDRQDLEGVRFVNPFTENFRIEEWS